METAFKQLLESSVSIAALAGDRIYPIILPQGFTRPALTYQVISITRQYTQDPTVAALAASLVQVDIWGDTYAQTVALRTALIETVDAAFSEEIGSPPVYFNKIFVVNERDGYEAALDQVGPALYRKSVDLEVWANIA